MVRRPPGDAAVSRQLVVGDVVLVTIAAVVTSVTTDGVPRVEFTTGSPRPSGLIGNAPCVVSIEPYSVTP